MTVQGISWLGAALFLLNHSFCAAEPVLVYQYKDSKGITVFTDKAPAGTRFLLRKYDCLACRVQAQLDWTTTPLFLTEYQPQIQQAARLQQLDPALLRAVIHAESGFNPKARSASGALGLMQIMPATARELGVADSLNVAENIQAGAAYLKQQLQRFPNQLGHALAAYNAGPETVRQYQGVPPYTETQRYVSRVQLLLQRYRSASLPVPALAAAPPFTTPADSIPAATKE